jgi:hypothetical protein
VLEKRKREKDVIGCMNDEILFLLAFPAYTIQPLAFQFLWPTFACPQCALLLPFVFCFTSKSFLNLSVSLGAIWSALRCSSAVLSEYGYFCSLNTPSLYSASPPGFVNILISISLRSRCKILVTTMCGSNTVRSWVQLPPGPFLTTGKLRH